MTVTNGQYDVAIVGAGPAGSSAAIRLAHAGLSVALVEQKRFPREKLCGEFVSPECLWHFDELGVMPAIRGIGGPNIYETVFYSKRGNSVSICSEWFGNGGSIALGISRAAMDLKLIERAAELGVDVRTETSVTGVVSLGDAVTGLKTKPANGVESELRAKVYIDATGRTRALARRFEPKDLTKAAASSVAFKTHLRGAQINAHSCEIYSYNNGYGGCNRVEDDLFNLCFIVSSADARYMKSDPERVLREVVFRNERAAAVLRRVEIVKPWHAVPIERFGRGELVPANGLFTIGDSAAFIDPFTGSGMLMALESAKIAAEVIVDSRDRNAHFDHVSENYREKYSAAFDRRLRFCSMLRHAASIPFWSGAMIAALRFSPFLRQTVARATRSNAAISK
ncbi:MAG: NAD(P)/FAD-dependent oxidoreductase [Acidobacteriota bacterium]|nr:MAG: NAD(P)/FAD-dependent oxidoreductase [Acidobacteriota bacterium]